MTTDGQPSGRRTDWNAWHHDYTEAGSPLARRLEIIRPEIRRVFAAADARSAGGRSEPLTVLSACAGDGRDILEILAERHRRGEHRPEPRSSGAAGAVPQPPPVTIEVTLIETDPRNLERAALFCRHEGLTGVRLRDCDAGLAGSYLGAVPADLVLMCGVFGNLADPDVRRLVEFLPRLCGVGATLIWTRTRRPPDLTPTLRNWLAAAGFTELSFTAPPNVQFAVGVHRFDAQPLPLPGTLADQRLFSFVR